MIIDIDNLETCDIAAVKSESIEEGYNMINRLIADYRSGYNRFHKKGEKLAGFISAGKIVAVCGLNIEPTDSRLGRIRRLYVLKDYRNRQIGTELVKYLLEHAKQHFDGAAVNIGDLPVSNFYIFTGLNPVTGNKSYTHVCRFRE